MKRDGKVMALVRQKLGAPAGIERMVENVGGYLGEHGSLVGTENANHNTLCGAHPDAA